MNQSLAKQFAPCPKCGANISEKMSFTWWGGVLGPKLLTHVKCGNCSAQYNGKTGKENTSSIIIYTIVVGIICLLLIGFVVAALILVTVMN